MTITHGLEIALPEGCCIEYEPTTCEFEATSRPSSQSKIGQRGFDAQQYIAQPNFSEGMRMGWLVRLREEATGTSCPDVMPAGSAAAIGKQRSHGSCSHWITTLSSSASSA